MKQHKLYTFTNGKIKVNEVVKGGSLGHGTAVNGDFDIDLVIYSECKFLPACSLENVSNNMQL